MECFLVGGAVRDYLLNLSCHERDWVVIGATPQTMLDKGFKQIGNDFPVFLHPITKEEYALARTERKSAPGHKGFLTDASASISLEDDLRRRDLTINAMAMNDQKIIIDPYGGQSDLKNRCLRHVSPAFSEDPLRVFRLARFYARYAHMGFEIHPATEQLCVEIASSGELALLSAERIWKETKKALAELSPHLYLEFLSRIGALTFWMHQLHDYVSNAEVVEPYFSWFELKPLLVELSATIQNGALNFALITSQLKEVALINDVHALIKSEVSACQLAKLVHKFWPYYQCARENSGEWVLSFLKESKSLGQHHEPYNHSLLLLDALDQKRKNNTSNIRQFIGKSREAVLSISANSLKTVYQLNGPELGAAINQARADAITAIHQAFFSS